MKIQSRHGHFDWLAPIYDRVFGAMTHEALFAHLDAHAGQLILDIGGGTGRVAEHLHRLDARVLVVDPSSGMLNLARAKGLPAVRSLAERLPFSSASIDRIYVVDAFHHFARQPEAARELLRVLRGGGRLVIEEPDLRRWPVKFVALAEKLALMQSHFYSPPDLARLFTAAGAELLTIAPDRLSAHIVLTKPRS